MADIGDESVANLLADLDAVFIDRHVHDLREVGNARQRLAAGTYGVCAGCGQGIGYERLAVYPTAVRCFACESQREKTYAHEGTPTL